MTLEEVKAEYQGLMHQDDDGLIDLVHYGQDPEELIRIIPLHEEYWMSLEISMPPADVWIIDGARIRIVWTDFCLGGHELKYPWMTLWPKYQGHPMIFIERLLDMRDMVANLEHEASERPRMARGIGYEDAHAMALIKEEKLRFAVYSKEIMEEIGQLREGGE